jgi:hypothetical protein
MPVSCQDSDHAEMSALVCSGRHFHACARAAHAAVIQVHLSEGSVAEAIQQYVPSAASCSPNSDLPEDVGPHGLHPADATTPPTYGS